VLLAKAGHSEEEILLADCERGKLDVVRTHWPFLRDRRVDAYGDISKRFID
jgi:N-carbamoylputrescine amidase